MKRKTYGLRLDQDLMKALQRLGIDLDQYTNDLVEEAIRDLLGKYENRGLPPKVKS